MSLRLPPRSSFPNSVWERTCPRNSVALALLLALCSLAPAQTNSPGPVILPPTTQAPPPDNTATFQPPPPSANPPPSLAPQPPSLNPAVANPPPAAGPGPNGDEIYDIRPPLFFLRNWLWLWIALATLAAAAFLIWLFRWFRGRSVLNPKNAYDLALEKLEKARALMNTDDPAPYAVAVSEAIRTYLGQRFLSPSTRRTTEEFLRQMEADKGTPLAEHRDLLRDFLQSCDLLKFARYQPSLAELEQVQQRAVSFVTATKPVANPNQRTSELVPQAT